MSTLSLSELRDSLAERGVVMSLSALSEFVKSGDIAAQLRVGGKGNRLEFCAETVDVLAAFFPQYREAKGRLPQAAPMLRSFLKPDNSEALVPVPEFRREAELARYGDEGLRLLREISETLKQVSPPHEDALLTAEAAAQILSCHPRSVHRFVPPVKRGRWKRSAILQYIQDL